MFPSHFVTNTASNQTAQLSIQWVKKLSQCLVLFQRSVNRKLYRQYEEIFWWDEIISSILGTICIKNYKKGITIGEDINFWNGSCIGTVFWVSYFQPIITIFHAILDIFHDMFRFILLHLISQWFKSIYKSHLQ